MRDRKTFIPFGNTNDHSIDFLLGIMLNARITTLQRVDDLSTEELHWQFDTGWNTIGALLSHIIAAEYYFRIEFIEERYLNEEERKIIMPGLEMGKFIPQLITTDSIDKYIERLEDSRTKMFTQIQQLDITSFHKKREGYHPETGYNLA
ncbi:MAG: hypothetical protein ACI94Y_001061 [Maribacter sp.]|jgi:hypothetical protein